jgi:hypothetical protein
MSELLRLQKEFKAYVFDGASAILPAISGDAAAPATLRMDVYADAYRLRLLEVLGDEFPGLRHLCGDERLESLLRAYIERTPSRFYNVRWYGGALSAFLRETQPQSPALAEMAELEWALTLSFDAPDAPPVTFAEVASLPPDRWANLRLRFSPALQRRCFGWNAGAIRRAIDEGGDVPQAQELALPEHWASARRDFVVRYRALPDDEAASLTAMSEGADFAAMCEALCEWHAEEAVAMRGASLMRRWVEDQWVSGLD